MNKQGIFSGRTNTPLAPEGIEQAEGAGVAVKKLNIDLIITSPLERATETAVIIAQAIDYPVENIVSNELFTERAFGVLEGTPYTSARYISGQEGVESDEAIVERARQGIEYLKRLAHNNILVVAHGSIGRAMHHILDPSIEFDETDGFKNAEVVQFL